MPRLCITYLEKHKGDADKAAKVLGIPARSVRMYATQGYVILQGNKAEPPPG